MSWSTALSAVRGSCGGGGGGGAGGGGGGGAGGGPATCGQPTPVNLASHACLLNRYAGLMHRSSNLLSMVPVPARVLRRLDSALKAQA